MGPGVVAYQTERFLANSTAIGRVVKSRNISTAAGPCQLAQTVPDIKPSQTNVAGGGVVGGGNVAASADVKVQAHNGPEQ